MLMNKYYIYKCICLMLMHFIMLSCSNPDLNTNGYPALKDTDGDGYFDGPDQLVEYEGSILMYRVGEDKNGDGIYDPDGLDDIFGTEDDETDPSNASSFPSVTAIIQYSEGASWHDSDSDGLYDAEEDLNLNGIYEPLGRDQIAGTFDDESDFMTADWDCDDDGLSNKDEKYIYQTDYSDADTDDDGLPDGLEVGVTSRILGPDGKEDGVADGMGGYNPNDGTYINIANVTGQPSTPMFEFGYKYNGYNINESRPCFIVDSDFLTRTDPTLADTNFEDDFDGVDDSNYNGRIDAGEKDPALGITELTLNGHTDIMDLDNNLRLLGDVESDDDVTYKGTFGIIVGGLPDQVFTVELEPSVGASVNVSSFSRSDLVGNIVPYLPFTVTLAGAEQANLVLKKEDGSVITQKKVKR